MKWFYPTSDWLVYGAILFVILSVIKIYLFFLKKDKNLPIGGIHFLYRLMEYIEITKKESGRVGIWIYVLVISIITGIVGMLISY